MGETRWQATHNFLRRLVKGGGAKLGLVLMILVLLFCFAGPLVSPYGINDIDILNSYTRPCLAHPFGCDSMGRDIMTRLMVGGRFSLALGLSTALLSSAIGIAFGEIAGYFGKTTENIIMRAMDVWCALPGMLLCILVSAAMGSGFFSTVIALMVGSIPAGTRMTRGQVISERNKEYIEAAEAINCPKFMIIFKHLLVNTIQPMIIVSTMSIGNTITMAASLAYIGLGIQPPSPEWGAMLADGRSLIKMYPHLVTFPGLIIAVTVLALNLLGDGLRDAMDPKMRD